MDYQNMGHHVSIEGREKITITQVTDVDAFDEAALWANLKDGAIEVTGQGLHIEKLDLEQGTLMVSGRISSLTYTDKVKKVKHGFLSGLGKERK